MEGTWTETKPTEDQSEPKIPVSITDKDKLEKLCSCWYSAYPFTADLFCKGSASKCEDLATKDDRKAAVWDDFVCS
jgi:hypothetical protein